MGVLVVRRARKRSESMIVHRHAAACLGHVAHVGPVVVGVLEHAASDRKDKGLQGRTAESEPFVQVELQKEI